jgi:peptide methionine sulfoxide reductase MsrB
MSHMYSSIHMSYVAYVHGVQIVNMKTERGFEVKALKSDKDGMYICVICQYEREEISKLSN